MFGRKYRLHIEEEKYIFQYEGGTLPTPSEMSEYIKAFRHSCAASLASIKMESGEVRVLSLDSQKSGPVKMGF